MSFKETGFAIEAEMQFRANRYGLKVTEVPINTNYDEKVQRSPVVHGFRVLGMMKGSFLNNINGAKWSKE